MKDWIYPNQNRQSPLSTSPGQPANTPFPYVMPDVRGGVPSYFYPSQGTGLLLPVTPFPLCTGRDCFERDKRYLTSLYPDFLVPILESIKERLDDEQQKGGFLSDRYPDKERLLRMVYEIYDRLSEEQQSLPMPLPAENSPENEFPPLTIPFTKDPRNPCLLALIQVLLSNEILAGRGRYRR